MYRIELRSGKKHVFPEKAFPGFKKRMDRGEYYAKDVKTEGECKFWVRKGDRKRLHSIVIDMNLNRSSTYRKKLIQSWKEEHGSFWCVYCGRSLSESEMEVEHIISIASVHKNKRLRKAVSKYSDGVNDTKNLVPSCRRCNRKLKGASSSVFWRFRARLGRRKEYWMFRFLLDAVLLTFCILWLYRNPFLLKYFWTFISVVTRWHSG